MLKELGICMTTQLSKPQYVGDVILFDCSVFSFRREYQNAVPYAVLVLLQVSPAAANGGDRAAAAAAMDDEMENERRMAAMVCSIKNKDDCVMCGS